MGGEKLNSKKPHVGVLLAGLLIFIGFFCFNSPLSAQTLAPLPGEEAAATAGTSSVDESSILIGEALAVPEPSGGSSFFIVIRMVLVLALAALAIYGVVFFIKRLARPRETRDPHLKVLARTALSNDSYAAVLSVGHKAWLVAGGSGGVNLISEIDETESLETMLLEEERRMTETGNKPLIDFRSLLSKLGSSRSGRKDPGFHGDDGSLPDKLRRQRERLRQ